LDFKKYYKPGGVFKCYLPFDKPKLKRFVIVCTNPVLYYFVINSGINDFIRKRESLLAHQLGLKADTENIIKHDSYINCGDLKSDLIKDQVKNCIKNSDSKILGFLSSNAILLMIKVVLESDIISQHEKLLIETDFKRYYSLKDRN